MPARQSAPHDPILRISEQLAALGEKVDAASHSSAAAAADAREARDGMMKLGASLEAQNVPERLASLKAETATGFEKIKQDVSAVRSDLVNAIGRENTAIKEVTDDLGTQITAVCKRLDILETDRAKAIGVAQFFAWLSRVSPWIAAVAVGLAAGLGWKGKLGA